MTSIDKPVMGRDELRPKGTVSVKHVHVCSQVRETSQLKHLDITGESQKEFLRLQEDKQRLEEQVEVCCGLLFGDLFLHLK